MGWTSFDKAYCVLDKAGRVNKKETMTHELESYGDTKVIRAAMAGGNYYGVVLSVPRNEYYLIVCLTGVKDGEFFYKDMSDTMLPYEHDCPASILDLADKLCPTDEKYDPSGNARIWRDKCRAKLAEKNSPTAFKNVPYGGRIVWHVPNDSGISFRGAPLSGSTLVLSKEKGRRKWLCYDLMCAVSLKLVKPSDCELYVEQASDERSDGLFTNVREWYHKEFPNDGIWVYMDHDTSFQLVSECLRLGGDIYSTLGTGDSVVRERVFQKLADIKGVSYNEIYERWIQTAG